jgi:hypothetical protein
MHLSSRASQTDASEAKASFTNRYILFSEASQKIWMHLNMSKASDKADLLKAVYRQLETKWKKKDEAESEKASESSQQQECI